jgi:cytochrome c553
MAENRNDRIHAQWLVAPLALMLLAAGFAPAQDSIRDTGRNLAASCASCHGTNGASAAGMSALAGRSKAELQTQMREYKSGGRDGTVMPQLARGYTDEQIERVTSWFASQRAAQ